jgi:hypothetical protein
MKVPSIFLLLNLVNLLPRLFGYLQRPIGRSITRSLKAVGPADEALRYFGEVTKDLSNLGPLVPLGLAVFFVGRIDKDIKANSDLLSKEIKATNDLLSKDIKATNDLLSKDIKATNDLLSKDIKANAEAIKELKEIVQDIAKSK